MSSGPTYADGTPVEDGDWVMIERGTTYGRVIEVIGSKDLTRKSQFRGPGVVVDAQPRGYVFLSSVILRDDPLHFVRRGPRERTRMLFVGLLAVGLVMVIPALYSFISGLHAALTTGEVLVISLGRTETYRAMVPWQQGWARFVGPIFMTASLLAFDGSRGLHARWWFAAIGTTVGLALLGFSAWFVSVERAGVFIGLMLAAAFATFLKRRFGTTAALGFLMVGLAALLWRAYSHI